MKKGGVGGSNTLTGLKFEAKVDLQQILSNIPGYRVDRIPNRAGMGLYFDGNLVARCFKNMTSIDFLRNRRFTGQKFCLKNYYRRCLTRNCKRDFVHYRSQISTGCRIG